MYRIKKAAAAIYGWDWPLLTFIYPGFDCGSPEDTSTTYFTASWFGVKVLGHAMDPASYRWNQQLDPFVLDRKAKLKLTGFGNGRILDFKPNNVDPKLTTLFINMGVSIV